MRLGLFGGSFDPVHIGHLLLAECCREQCQLDEIWFVPAAAPPHKRARVLTSATQRIEMLELAVGGNPAFRVCRHEIDRGGISYTVDTLATIAAQRPDDALYLLLGADSLADLPHWREPARVCTLAMPVAVGRPGAEPADYSVLAPLVSAERLAQIRQQQVTMPLVELSSSELRRRVAAGESIRYRTPRAVEKYIQAERLYSASTEPPSAPARAADC